MLMARDIDYAATAVQTALVEKYGRKNEMEDLQVIAQERTIAIQHAGRVVEGTRDNLLAAVRKSETYDDFWKSFAPTPK